MGSLRMGISDFLCVGYGEKWVRLVFFLFGDSWGAPARPPLLNPWWHGGWGGLGELGGGVLKAGGIEIWSSGNGLREGEGVTQELFPREGVFWDN